MVGHGKFMSLPHFQWPEPTNRCSVGYGAMWKASLTVPAWSGVLKNVTDETLSYALRRFFCQGSGGIRHGDCIET